MRRLGSHALGPKGRHKPMSDETPAGRDGGKEEAGRVLADVAAGACRFVELHFTDVAGAMKSVVLPASQLADAIRYGHWFDGSALEAAGRTMETDLLLCPDLATWGILPWSGAPGERTGRML